VGRVRKENVREEQANGKEGTELSAGACEVLSIISPLRHIRGLNRGNSGSNCGETATPVRGKKT